MPESVKTSLDEAEKQSSDDKLAGALEQAGVESVDELVRRSKEFGTLQTEFNHVAAEHRKLKKEIKERKEKIAREDMGVPEDADPVLKTLATKMSGFEDKLSTIVATLTAEDGDKDLGPFLRQAEVEHPEIMAIEDDVARNKALRTVAKAMQANEVASGEVENARREGSEQATMASRTQFTGGGAGAGKKAELTDDDVLQLFKDDINGKRPKEIDAIKAVYKKKYPHLFE